MNDEEREKAVEYARKQKKSVSIDIPERGPDEEPITEKQLGYIMHLAPNLDEEEVKTLGKWQASSVIDQIKSQQDIFTDEMIDKYQKEKSRGCLGALIIFMGFLSGLLYCGSQFRGEIITQGSCYG